MSRDRELAPLGEVVAGLVPVVDPAAALAIRRIALDLPVELALEARGDGAWTLRAAPPLERFAATVRPVLHRLAITVEVADADARD